LLTIYSALFVHVVNKGFGSDGFYRLVHEFIEKLKDNEELQEKIFTFKQDADDMNLSIEETKGAFCHFNTKVFELMRVYEDKLAVANEAG